MKHLNLIDYRNLSSEEKAEYIKQKFANQKNTQPKNGLSVELTEGFEDLSCRLSPENLHCDGEITRAQAKVRYRQIMKEWKVLEKKAGRKVSESEFPY